MTKEDINFLISIQSLPDEEFQIAYLERELDKKENIIKEVREYIEEKYDYILGDDTFLDHDERIEKKQIDHILGILNKGE